MSNIRLFMWQPICRVVRRWKAKVTQGKGSTTAKANLGFKWN